MNDDTVDAEDGSMMHQPAQSVHTTPCQDVGSGIVTGLLKLLN